MKLFSFLFVVLAFTSCKKCYECTYTTSYSGDGVAVNKMPLMTKEICDIDRKEMKNIEEKGHYSYASEYMGVPATAEVECDCKGKLLR